MSDYHILTGRPDGNQFIVAFHLPIPDTNNAAGFSYRDAAAAQLAATWESIVPHITQTEQDAIIAGELYEHVWQYDTHPGVSLVDKRNELDAKFAAFCTAIINQLQSRLEFYGYDRDVP